MNDLIKEQLKKSDNCVLKYQDKVISIDDIKDDMTEFEIISLEENNLNLEIDKDYLFTFEGVLLNSYYIGHIRWNHSNPIPFRIMKGKVITRMNNLIFIECSGIKDKDVTICSKCLKPGRFNVLCDNCKKLYDNIEDVTWKGWIPLTTIREVEEI